MPDDDFQKKLTAKRDEEAKVSGAAPAAPAQAAAPVPTANQTQTQTQTFEDAEGARASAVATEAAQPAAPAQPAPAQPSDGTKEVAPGETAPVESDDVKKLRLQLENQLRIKGIDTALQLWRDARSREQALQDKDFERWKQQNAIAERNSMIRQLSGARDIKWTYHGTFANGVLTSNWSGTATNPYKDLLQKLEGEAAGDNPYAAFRESTRKSGLEAPDWLKALLPEGDGGRKPAGELDVKPGEQPAQQRRGTSVVTAYRELSRPGDYLKAGRTSRVGFGPESLTLFRETRAQSGNRTLTERRERTTFGVPILENLR